MSNYFELSFLFTQEQEKNRQLKSRIAELEDLYRDKSQKCATFHHFLWKKNKRIAELEAEVERLKKPFIWKGDDLEELTEEVIRNRSMVDFEEGELKVQTLVDFEEGNG